MAQLVRFCCSHKDLSCTLTTHLQKHKNKSKQTKLSVGRQSSALSSALSREAETEGSLRLACQTVRFRKRPKLET